jgi:hypothetical protein
VTRQRRADQPASRDSHDHGHQQPEEMGHERRGQQQNQWHGSSPHDAELGRLGRKPGAAELNIDHGNDSAE